MIEGDKKKTPYKFFFIFILLFSLFSIITSAPGKRKFTPASTETAPTAHLKEVYRPEQTGARKQTLTLDINTASAHELKSLPGIGPRLATAIIKYRENNRFRKPADLMYVRGIGSKRYDKIKNLITVSARE